MNSRRTALKLVGTAIGAALLGALPFNIGRAKSRSRLNILFICTDQERSWMTLPAGLPLPAHELLLSEGRGFENCHVNTTPCGPSRSTIYTGQHTQKTGVYVNPNTPPGPELPVHIPTIGHMLREQGYYTAYRGKWHLSNIKSGPDASATTEDALEKYGFSRYDRDGDKIGLTWAGHAQDGSIAEDAASLLHELAQRKEAPWFFAVNFVNPHDVMFYDATGTQYRTRPKPNLAAPLRTAPETDLYKKEWNFDLPRSFYQDDLSTKPEQHRRLFKLVEQFYGPMALEDLESWRRVQNYYFNCIRDVDRHVMTVIEALKKSGQWSNTIVFYTSDHGDRAGAHRLRRKGATMYKEDVGVPLIVRHPDVRGGATKALASAVDLAPTLLSFAGMSAAQRRDRYPGLVGVDLSGAVADANERTERDRRGHLFDYATRYYWDVKIEAQYASAGNDASDIALTNRSLHRGVHDGRFKFARYFAPAQHHRPDTWEALTAHNDLELYDTKADPDEIENLAVKADRHRELLLALNGKTNALVDLEVGRDDGSEYPGPVEIYNTLKV